MKITDGEKIILFMLSKVYKELEITDSIGPDFIEKAITKDALWAIPFKTTEIPFENNELPEFVEKVLSILGMWRGIEFSFDRFDDEKKASLLERIKKEVKFCGFDGNNESEYLNAASFLIEECDRFTEFQGRDLNSHCPKLKAYERMLPVYREIHNNLAINESLSEDDIANLLLAENYPSEE